MGIIVKSPTEDNTYSAQKLAFPVVGARYMNVFGGSDSEVTKRNLALNNPITPTVIGNPVVNADHVVFTSLLNYVDTNLNQTPDLTILVVAEPTNDSDQCVFVSNAGVGGNPGVNLFVRDETEGDSLSKLLFGVAEGTSANANTVTQNSEISFSQYPIAIAARYDDTSMSKTLDELKRDITTSDNDATQSAALSNSLKIGSTSEATAYPVPVKMYFAAIWDRALTDAEVQTAYTWLKDFYLAKHAINI